MSKTLGTYWDALHYCRNYGRDVESRLGGARELLNVTFDQQPFDLPRRRRMRRELGYMELCQLLCGDFSLAEIERVAPRVNLEMFGASAIYGPRITLDRDQLHDAIEELRRFPASRRALVTVTDPPAPLIDQPCISSFQFQIRHGMLYTTVNIRSWDLWFGAPHDLITIAGVAQVVAQCASTSKDRGFPLGAISLFVANAHIYAGAIDDAGGPELGWFFELPTLRTLTDFRAWADDARGEVGWTSGPPPGLKSEHFPKIPKLPVAVPLEM